MTRDEAITVLLNVAWLGTDEERERIEEAVSMAIEALKQGDVLQEIRQEIDSHGIIMQISNGEKIIGENVYIAKEIVLEIIDKHISGKET